jgi:hypothetical protein
VLVVVQVQLRLWEQEAVVDLVEVGQTSLEEVELVLQSVHKEPLGEEGLEVVLGQ